MTTEFDTDGDFAITSSDNIATIVVIAAMDIESSIVSLDDLLCSTTELLVDVSVIKDNFTSSAENTRIVDSAVLNDPLADFVSFSRFLTSSSAFFLMLN